MREDEKDELNEIGKNKWKQMKLGEIDELDEIGWNRVKHLTDGGSNRWNRKK